MHSILAVDDSASMRQMVSFTLKSAGYNVVEAVDGQDAWEKAGSRDFDLVLFQENKKVDQSQVLAVLNERFDLTASTTYAGARLALYKRKPAQ